MRGVVEICMPLCPHSEQLIKPTHQGPWETLKSPFLPWERLRLPCHRLLLRFFWNSVKCTPGSVFGQWPFESQETCLQKPSTSFYEIYPNYYYLESSLEDCHPVLGEWWPHQTCNSKLHKSPKVLGCHQTSSSDPVVRGRIQLCASRVTVRITNSLKVCPSYNFMEWSTFWKWTWEGLCPPVVQSMWMDMYNFPRGESVSGLMLQQVSGVFNTFRFVVKLEERLPKNSSLFHFVDAIDIHRKWGCKDLISFLRRFHEMELSSHSNE